MSVPEEDPRGVLTLMLLFSLFQDTPARGVGSGCPKSGEPPHQASPVGDIGIQHSSASTCL